MNARSALAAAGLAAAFALAPTAAPAQTMSPLDRLVAKDEIRQQLVLYALLADGDGVTEKNVRALADRTLTPDVVTDLFFPDGSLQDHSIGREATVNGTPPPVANRPTAGRHYLVNTYFDELTPSTAKTRTTAFYIELTKNILGKDCAKAGLDACGGRVVHGITLVYHNTWKKTADGWQMSSNVLRRDN